MKFTDGQWLLQPGVAAHYASETYDVQVHGDQLRVLATTRPIKHRGDTLQGPTLTLTISSPVEGAIRVQVEHFSASEAPRLHIPMVGANHPKVQIEETETAWLFTSGALTAELKKGEGWSLIFREGTRILTKSDWRSLGYIQWGRRGNHVHEQLTLSVGESVYGLGERFTPWVKNGQIVENSNRDGGTACEQAYKSVPFYLSSRGYGVLVDEAGPVSFEMGSEKVARVQFSREGESLAYVVFAGPTPKDVLGRLTALTGRAPLPPAWSFGLWMTTSFTTQYDEATATHFIDEMKRRELPLAVFHFDCFWMREFQWCDFQWDKRGFPEPEAMLARLKAKGLRISLWINPYVAQQSPLFAEGSREGYFIKRSNGLTWQTDQWQPGMAIVDFTNPAAKSWYQGHLRRLLAMGVDCFKTDFGERIPDQGVQYFDGSDPVEMHNLYALQYNEAVFDLIREVRGDAEAVVFARSTYASGQRFPVHWGGDCWSTFESMAESLRGGLSLSACGFAFWSHDIGGFEGNPPPAVYKRWIQFGLMSSHSRLHGSSFYRVPWLVDEESCVVLQRFTHLKHQLMPYLYAKAIEATQTGVPMMRAMVVEHPHDPACATLDRQYQLGESLLVAPVFTTEGEVEFYLPDSNGRWTHLLSGQQREGGRWYRETHDFMSMPLYVAPNTVLPWGAETEKPDYAYEDGVTLRVFELADGATASFEVASQSGAIAARGTVARAGSRYTATVSEGALRNWCLDVNSRRSAVQANAATLDWTAE